MAWELASIGDIKIIDTEQIKAVLKLALEQQEAITRVRELHNPETKLFDEQRIVCYECIDYYGDPTDYPCPTIKALEGEQ